MYKRQEKKWATSGALAGLFTVMAKQKMADGSEKVTALVLSLIHISEPTRPY